MWMTSVIEQRDSSVHRPRIMDSLVMTLSTANHLVSYSSCTSARLESSKSPVCAVADWWILLHLLASPVF